MYAEKTSVSIDRSQGEIKKILAKYNASAFAFAESEDRSMVQFEMSGRRIKFLLPMPVKGVQKNKKGWLMGENEVAQLSRSRWRSLVIAIKAKLECVECGITTLEQEFMAHIVLPNGQTVGDVMTPQIKIAYEQKIMPSLLGMGPK